MTESKSQKPSAFVIMPFGEGFDEIYGLFIAGALRRPAMTCFGRTISEHIRTS